MQDEIVARLASALNAQLVAAEARRAEQAPNPDSMDLYFQGLAWYNKGLTPGNLEQARGFFDRRCWPTRTMSTRSLDRRACTWSRAECPLSANPVAAFTAAEAKLTKALSLCPGPRAWPYVFGSGRHIDQARRAGHRRK